MKKRIKRENKGKKEEGGGGQDYFNPISRKHIFQEPEFL
jgi:hypothetical protein